MKTTVFFLWITCISLLISSFLINTKIKEMDKRLARIEMALFEINQSQYYKKDTCTLQDSILNCIINNCNTEHKDIIYAQILLETGRFTSPAFVKHNNLFGIIDVAKTNETGVFHTRHFSTWQECFDFYMKNIYTKHKNDESYCDFLNRINYAADTCYVKKLRKIAAKQKF